jgi:hypothetical protein
MIPAKGKLIFFQEFLASPKGSQPANDRMQGDQRSRRAQNFFKISPGPPSCGSVDHDPDHPLNVHKRPKLY